MKLIANLLLVVSLSTAALAASTAYYVRLNLPEERLLGLTLNDDAGRREAPDGTSEPLLKKGRELTGPEIDLLRDNNVAFVHVQQFDVRRWPGGLVFLVSLVVMTGSAVWIQRLNHAGAVDARDSTRRLSPVELLHAGETAVHQLIAEVEAADSPADQTRLIVRGMGAIGREQLAAFVEVQPLLKEQLGLAAAAEVMSRFATAERQANRCWSAAADGHAQEAVTCLRATERLLADTRQSLN